MENTNNLKDFLQYKPSKKNKSIIDGVYNDVEDMIAERNRVWPQFNDRTLIQFLDDSEKRVQGYVPTREAQNKEEWQSNVFRQETRNKCKALVASMASTIPSLKYKAVSNQNGEEDSQRAEVMENLVLHSRFQSNPQVNLFWEAWTAICQGTIISYDGYIKTKAKRKFIKSYDLVTGELEFSEEKEVIINDECIDFLIPNQDLYIDNFEIPDIQEQPKIAWIRYLPKEVAEFELSKYPNWKYVPTSSNAEEYRENANTFFNFKWTTRTEGEEYEVIKYYNKYKDQYSIIVNGILLLNSPLLWGYKKKYYPFAKSIFEPFANRNFFYGNSLPNANMDAQDVINSLYNLALDKTKRSLNPPMLVGNKNKDLIEVENEAIGMDTILYVDDVQQVIYQNIPGLNNSELAMIKWVTQGLDLGSVDPNQQGMASRGVTAREVVIANENALRLKGLFDLFLTDLWVQKTKLRIINILTNYPQSRYDEVVGKDVYRTFFIQNSNFPLGNKGTLRVKMVGKNEPMPTAEELQNESKELSKKNGQTVESIAMPIEYLDNFDYDVEVIPDSLFKQNSSQALIYLEDKLNKMATYFPDKFLANKDVLFRDFIRAYGDSDEKYQNQTPVPQTAGNPIDQYAMHLPAKQQTGIMQSAT